MLRSNASSDSPRTSSISRSRESTRPACCASTQSSSNWWPVSARGSPVKFYCARIAVDLEPADAQARPRHRRGAPAQDRAQPRQQLARAEGLGEVIVGAELESDDAIGLLAARGEHQDREIGSGPHAATHLEAIEIGEHHVEDQGVDPAARGAREPARAVATRRHLETRRAEILGEHRGEALVVFDDQDALGHASLAWRAPWPARSLLRRR